MFRLLFFISHHLFLTIAGISGLLFLVTIHEFGHFFMCKLFGVGTPSFSIGFGPHLISKKIGDTLFSISAIPLGGYVEIAGNAEIGQGEQKSSDSRDKNSFANRPFYQKFMIMIGGILANMIFAYLIGIIIFLAGTPQSRLLYPFNASPVIEKIEEGSAAAQAGLKDGDKIIAADNLLVGNDTKKLISFIHEHPGKNIALTVDRSGEQIVISITPENKEFFGKQIGIMGVMFTMTTKRYPLIGAIRNGVALINFYAGAMVASLKHVIMQRDTSSVGGPVAIIGATASQAQQGILAFLFFLALLSINLAIINLIPLPIFDGGQILFALIEAIIGKPLPEKIRWVIHLTSWILVMFLFIFLTFRDVIRMIGSFFQK